MIVSKVTVYNTAKKVEEVIELHEAEGINTPSLPDNCHELSRVEVSREEVKRKLSPENFMLYSEVVHEEDEA